MGLYAWANDRLSAFLGVTAGCRTTYDSHTLCGAAMTKQSSFNGCHMPKIVKFKVSELTDQFVFASPGGTEGCLNGQTHLEKKLSSCDTVRR